MSGQMRCLPDKVTARDILEGTLRLVEGRELAEAEVYALDLFERAQQADLRLFIIPPPRRSCSERFGQSDSAF